MVTNGVTEFQHSAANTNEHPWYFARPRGAWDILAWQDVLRGGYGIAIRAFSTGQECSYSCAVNPSIIPSVNLG